MILYHIATECPQCGHRTLHAAVLPGDPRFTRFSCSWEACAADWHEIGDNHTGPVTESERGDYR